MSAQLSYSIFSCAHPGVQHSRTSTCTSAISFILDPRCYYMLHPNSPESPHVYPDAKAYTSQRSYNEDLQVVFMFCVIVDECLCPTEPSLKHSPCSRYTHRAWLNGLDINTVQDTRSEYSIGRTRRQKRMEIAVAQFHAHKLLS